MAQQKALPIRSIFSLSAIYGIAPFIDKIISFITLPILTRYLDPHEYSALVLLFTFSLFYQLLVIMGLNEALTKVYWEYKGRELKECLGTTWVSIVLLNAFVGIPIFIFANVFFKI
jgi:O-antigen/teichoic acid export membrane protein